MSSLGLKSYTWLPIPAPLTAAERSLSKYEKSRVVKLVSLGSESLLNDLKVVVGENRSSAEGDIVRRDGITVGNGEGNCNIPVPSICTSEMSAINICTEIESRLEGFCTDLSPVMVQLFPSSRRMRTKSWATGSVIEMDPAAELHSPAMGTALRRDKS